jgi:LysR family glycine cleavage system transcriptional activator
MTYMLTLRNGVYMPKFRLPALNSLPAFEAAARHQSIKKASDELHVTHGAVSRHIQKLEQQVGRDLFVRHHRQIVLTEDGEIFLRAVTMAFYHIQRATAQVSRNRHPERLVISVDPDFAALWLVPRLAEFYAIVPNTLVEILAKKSDISLQDPRIDCAIQYAEAGLDLENSEILFRSRLFPVCAPSLAKMLPLRSPEDLQHHTLLHDRSTVEWQQYVQGCSMSIDINVGSGLIFSETSHCLDAAVRGQGVAIGDDFLAEMYLSEGRLIRVFDSSFLSKNAYYLVVPEPNATHPAIDAFRNWLLQSIYRVRNMQGDIPGANG